MTDRTGMRRDQIAPERWPSEGPLYIAVALCAILIWLLLIVSIFGILYAIFLGIFIFVSQLAFVAFVRGSGVRIGPNQFPELHARVVEMSRAMGMEPPATYLMQAGGTLNAFAARFLGRNIVVLYSDLLEACGENTGARDMIVAHELGHLRCGHLRYLWLTLPGHLTPFLGSALSRAREYTCDRFGALGAGSVADATLGLAILSAGPKFAPGVNLDAFVRQRGDLNTGLMTLGEWFGSHPPLSKRIAALDSTLGDRRFSPANGRAKALGILGIVWAGTAATAVGVFVVGGGLVESIEDLAEAAPTDNFDYVNPAIGAPQVASDFARISEFVQQHWGGRSTARDAR